MTLTTIAFHRDNPIYARDLKAYAADSKRSLRAHWYRKSERTRTYGFLVIFVALATLPFRRAIKARAPEIGLLLAATLLASHYVYA